MREVVYLVDDDAKWSATICELLDSSGIEVRSFPSAADFLAFLGTVSVPALRGCVLLDMLMPETSGEALFRALLERGVRLPIAILSAHVDSKKVSKLSAEGAANYITKTDQELEQEVQKLLQRHRDFLPRFAGYADILRRIGTLTDDERAVFELSMENEKVEWIADKLQVSPRKAFRDKASLKEKLNVRTTAELVKAYHDWQTGLKLRP
jgi:FixJ family two-component response regulator